MATNFWQQLKKPILALAPMEGVTDLAYRTINKRGGADVVYTEFVPADGIAVGAPKVMKKLVRGEEERPVIAQIFGRNPESFAKAAKEIEARGFDGLDINFGCPAKKVVGSGSGVALLRDPQYARKLVEVAVTTTSLPVSIKVRTSIRKERKEVAPGIQERYTALDLVEAIKDLPVAAIMVHGRSFEQGHSGEIDEDMIRQVKQHFNGVVLANGGLTTPERIREVIATTGVDGVGIARGTYGRPWMFRQTRALLDGAAPTEPTWEDVKHTAIAHAELMVQQKGEYGIIEFRKHLAHYVKGRPGAARLRREAVTVSSLADVRRVLDAFSQLEA